MHLLVTLLAACSGSGATTAPTPTATTGGTTSGTGSAGTATGSVAGTVRDLAGTPLAGIRMQLCDEIQCRVADTDEEGAYAYERVGGKTYSFDAVPPVDSGWATQLVPLELGVDEARTVDVALHELGPEVPIPATRSWIDLTDDLRIEVGEGDLEALFVTIDAMAAVRVAPEHFPPIDGLAGTPLALWYLAPYDARTPEGEALAWATRDALDLAEGEQVEAWAADYDAFSWVPAGVLEATPDGLELVEGGLTVISTLVVMRPDP